MLIIKALGLASSVLISVMFVPQVVHSFRTRDTSGINYTFLFINILASTMGLVYSLYYKVIPMIIANTSATLFSITLIPMKYLNGVRTRATDGMV